MHHNSFSRTTLNFIFIPVPPVCSALAYILIGFSEETLTLPCGSEKGDY